VSKNIYNIADVTSAITGTGTFTLVGKTNSNTGWSCASKRTATATRRSWSSPPLVAVDPDCAVSCPPALPARSW
jgi:hypothetical protein